MKLTIFAATGGIGRQLLEQAVAAGHDVTAVVRNPQSLPSTPACVVVIAARDDQPVAIPLRDLAEGNPRRQRQLVSTRK